MEEQEIERKNSLNRRGRLISLSETRVLVRTEKVKEERRKNN